MGSPDERQRDLRLSALSLALSVLVSVALMLALFAFTGGLRGTLS